MVEAFLKANESRIFEYCGISDEMPLKHFIKVADKLKNQLRNLPQVTLYRCDQLEIEKMQSKYSNSPRDNRGGTSSSDRDVVGDNDFNRLFYETQSIVQENSLPLSSCSVYDDDRVNTNSGHVSSTETTRASNALEQMLGNNLDTLRGTTQPSLSTYKRKAKRFSIDKSFENWILGDQTQSPKRKKPKSNTQHTSAESNDDEREEVNAPNITIAPDNSSATIVNVDVTSNGSKKGVIELEIPQSLTNSINMGSYKLKIDLSKITILKNFTKPAACSKAKSKDVVKKNTAPKPKASAPKKRGPKPRKAITKSSNSAEKSEVARFVELFSADCNEIIADSNMSPNSSNVISTTTGEIVQQAFTNGHPSTNDTVSSTEVSSNQIATIISTTNGSASSWYEQRSDELYTLPLDGLGDMPLVRYINDSAEVEIIDLFQTHVETNNDIENILVPYSKYSEQQEQRRSLSSPVQLNPPIMNAAISSMVPFTGPAIKMNTISEIDSDRYALDLTKQKSSSDNYVRRMSESAIINSNQSMSGPNMPSLDDVDDVVNVLRENDSNLNSKTNVEKPQKNTEISSAAIACSKTKDNFDYNNISGDLDEIDYTELLGDPHFDNDEEDAISLCASVCGTPFRDNLDDSNIPGEASFKHVYSSTPGPTTESDRASSMSRLELLKGTMATGLSSTTATTTRKDSVRTNNTIPDQPKQKQPSNDKPTPFKIPKVSQKQKVVKNVCGLSISPLVDPEFEDNVKLRGTPIQTPIKYSAGSNKEFEKQVIQLFGENLCYENINNDKCEIANCKYRHDLYGPEVMKNRLKGLEKKGLDIAYKHIKQRHKLFNIYFPIFCELFGEKNFRNKLVELTMDCQKQSGCAKYLKNVVDGLMKTDLTRQGAIGMAMQKLVQTSDAINVVVDLILRDDSDILEFIPKIEEFVKLKHKFTHNQIIRMAQISNVKQDIPLNKMVFIIISEQIDIVSTKNEHIINFLKMIEGFEEGLEVY